MIHFHKHIIMIISAQFDHQTKFKSNRWINSRTTYDPNINNSAILKKQELNIISSIKQTKRHFLNLHRLSHTGHPVPKCPQENLTFPIYQFWYKQTIRSSFSIKIAYMVVQNWINYQFSPKVITLSNLVLQVYEIRQFSL